MREAVKALCISRLISSKYGVGYMVGELYGARRTGIHKEWRIGKVLDRSPLGTNGSELYRHLLKCRLVCTLIEDYQSALRVSISTQALQVAVESRA